jgi:hypothetical protein
LAISGDGNRAFWNHEGSHDLSIAGNRKRLSARRKKHDLARGGAINDIHACISRELNVALIN